MFEHRHHRQHRWRRQLLVGHGLVGRRIVARLDLERSGLVGRRIVAHLDLERSGLVAWLVVDMAVVQVFSVDACWRAAARSRRPRSSLLSDLAGDAKLDLNGHLLVQAKRYERGALKVRRGAGWVLRSALAPTESLCASKITRRSLAHQAQGRVS